MSMTWLANADFETAWAHQAWTDFRDLPHKDDYLAVLPVFGIADHGLGQPMDAEELVGSEILHRATLHAKDAVKLRVLPPLRFVLAPYPNTLFGIDPETAHDLIRDVARSVQAAGFKKLVFWVTSPWNEELIDAASRDTRAELNLQTFVVNLSGLGLNFHPASDSRAQLQAAVSALTGVAADISTAPPGEATDPNFRPGRWRQPSPVTPDASLDGGAILATAGHHLATLLTEIDARAPLGSRTGRPLAALPSEPAPRHAESAPVWPGAYRGRYLPAMSRAQLNALPAKADALVLLPTGAIEQHGHHLPVGVDSILGQAWLNGALPLLPANAPVYVAPPIMFAKSNEHVGFPGTVYTSAKVLRRLLLALVHQLHALGFRRFATLNTHGGNSAVLIYTIRELQEALDIRIGAIGSGFRPPLSPQENEYGFHAGHWETALMLAAATPTVRMDRAVCEFPARLDDPGELRPENAPAIFSWISSDISASGVMGDATLATEADGQAWFAAACANLATRLTEQLT